MTSGATKMAVLGNRCHSSSCLALPDDFFTRVDSSQVRSAVYLIETHDNKHPKESSYGGRTIIKQDSQETDY